MASTTPNIGLTLPTGAENVSRQIINDNNTKIDTAIGTLNGKLIKTPTPITSGYAYNDRGSYEENGIEHIKGSVSTNFYNSGAGSYMTVAFTTKLPTEANGVLQPVVVGYQNKMVATVAKIEVISTNICIRVFITDDIIAFGNVTSAVYLNMDYAC